MLGAWDNQDRFKGGHVADEVNITTLLDQAAATNGEMSERTAQALGLTKKVGPMVLSDLIKQLVTALSEAGDIPVGFVDCGIVLQIKEVDYDPQEDWIVIK
jgi:hypothetical protein